MLTWLHAYKQGQIHTLHIPSKIFQYTVFHCTTEWSTHDNKGHVASTSWITWFININTEFSFTYTNKCNCALIIHIVYVFKKKKGLKNILNFTQYVASLYHIFVKKNWSIFLMFLFELLEQPNLSLLLHSFTHSLNLQTLVINPLLTHTWWGLLRNGERNSSHSCLCISKTVGDAMYLRQY